MDDDLAEEVSAEEVLGDLVDEVVVAVVQEIRFYEEMDEVKYLFHEAIAI